jgi:colanic acid/amylovoran biosynthesis glycosyltransferase
MSSSERAAGRIGCVPKMHSRFSETFIVNEMLALERVGDDRDLFSLRIPSGGHLRQWFTDVRAPVTYLPHDLRAREVWKVLRHGLDARQLAVNLPDVRDLRVADAAAVTGVDQQVRHRGWSRVVSAALSPATSTSPVPQAFADRHCEEASRAVARG